MKLSIYFTPLGVTDQAIAGRPVVVIDVLRTTTTIVAALANGARAILPAVSTEEALRLAQNLERDDVLLVGERGSNRVDGFALGNSPLDSPFQHARGCSVARSQRAPTPKGESRNDTVCSS